MRFIGPLSCSLVLMAAVAAAGCSGKSKKDADDPDKWSEMEDGGSDPEPRAAKSDPDPDPEPAGDDDDEPKPKPLSQADDYEINHRDCDALADAYGRAWKHDEMDKLNKSKLPKEKFEKAAAELDQGAEGMSTNWREECYGTVGTAYLRSRLKCAMKAKSLERFNNCMDGLADK